MDFCEFREKVLPSIQVIKDICSAFCSNMLSIQVNIV